MRSSPSVDRITRDGLSQMFQMDSNLVCATRARTAFHKGLAFVRGKDAVVGERLATTFIDGHFLAVDLVTTDGGFDLVAFVEFHPQVLSRLFLLPLTRIRPL